MYYHGSKTLIENGYLEPRISFELERWVYATDDYWYALLRSGNFDITKFLIREDINEDGMIQLAEVEPGAFKQVFDRTGYIYKVKEELFKQNREHEFVSENYIKIEETEVIDNIWNKIVKSCKYELIFYDNSDEYWSKVKGGKQGYLDRKRKYVEKILAMQNA